MFSKKICALVIAAGAVLVSTSSFAEVDSPLPTPINYDVPRTVSQMLEIDANRALMNEQRLLLEEQRKGGFGRLPGASGETVVQKEEKPADPPKAVEPPVRIDLLGIFGIGKDLQADVEINGNRYRYVRGYELPVGAGDDFRYRLVRIDIPCVLLGEVGGAGHKICLTKPSL